VLGAFADHVGAHTAFLLLPVFLGVSATAVLRLQARPRDGDAVDDREIQPLAAA
jgi:hypothetical protein